VRRAAVAAGILLAFYIPIILFTGLPDHLILFPTRNRIDARGAVRKSIPFQNGALEIWTADSSTAAEEGRSGLFLLRFYGNADRAERWVGSEAEMWGRRSIAVWGVNYPGFGGSTGPARLSHIGPASLAAFDALRQTAGDGPIIVFGTSLGAAAALHIAVNRPVAGLILQNPPPLKQMILRQFGWWNLWLLAGPIAAQLPDDLDSIANARRIHVPAIFLLAGQDEVVAPRFQRLVLEAYAGPKKIIPLPGAGHNSPIEESEMAELNKTLDWLLSGQGSG
jgi:uncharacterized protein